MEELIKKILAELKAQRMVEVERSARHVHLSQADLQKLFGPGAQLTPRRPLSQPGQFLSEERVTLVGPKGRKERTAVLGPVRAHTQVELSKSDCAELGVEAPLRESGDTAGSGAVSLVGPCGTLALTEGAIVARRHVHLTPETAQSMGLEDGQQVSLSLLTGRPLTFEDVLVRVSERFSDRAHLDFDEANAADLSGFTMGRLLVGQTAMTNPQRGG